MEGNVRKNSSMGFMHTFLVLISTHSTGITRRMPGSGYRRIVWVLAGELGGFLSCGQKSIGRGLRLESRRFRTCTRSLHRVDAYQPQIGNGKIL